MKVLEAAAAAMRAGRPAALVTVVGVNGSAPRAASARMLVYAGGGRVGTVGGGAFEHRLEQEAEAAIRAGAPRRVALNLRHDLGMCCGGAMEAFVEPLKPMEQLVIYGGGHVGLALAGLGQGLGFSVTVVDEREEFADPGRFPPGVRVLEADPLRVLDGLPFGAHCYHLVVTHRHDLDQDLVERLLPRELAWVGLIGSRAKVARFSLRLRAAGFDPALFERLAAPVGLDIGAETPEEIAVSVAAELIRRRRGCERVPLPLSSAGRSAEPVPFSEAAGSGGSPRGG